MHNKLSVLSLLIALVGVVVSSPALAGFDGYEVITQETAVDSVPTKQLSVNCPVGKYALGAGWGAVDKTGIILDGNVLYGMPSYDGTSWTFNVENISSYEANWKLRVRVVCASVAVP